MLLSLRKRLTIALCPSHVALMKTLPGWRPQPSQPVVVECTTNEDGNANKKNWQTPLAALRQALEHFKYEAADVNVILSDNFTRYALIPWSDDVQKRAELAALSQIHFESLFGAAAQQWHIHTDYQEYGAAGIGCAIDTELMTSLRSILATHKLRLVSLRPYLMSVINRWRNRLDRNALMAVVESGQCILVSVKNGTWQSIRTLKIKESVAKDLPVLINREILLQNLDPKCAIYLHALDEVNSGLLRQELNVTMLEMPSAISSRQASGLTMIASRA